MVYWIYKEIAPLEWLMVLPFYQKAVSLWLLKYKKGAIPQVYLDLLGQPLKHFAATNLSTDCCTVA